MKLKFLFILIFVPFLFSSLISFVFAKERGLEVQYPEIGEEKITTSTTMAEYAGYIFRFSFIIAAVAAFAVLIYGGFRYVISAGNPSAMDDAKKWIWGGIIGLILLLCSWLILKTIDPEFLQPEMVPLKPRQGIYLINEKDEKRYFYSPGAVSEIPEDFKAVKIEFLSDPPAEEFYADLSKEELISVFYFSEKNQGGNIAEVKNNKNPETPPPSSPQTLNFLPQSLYFFWQRPGVYLYEEENMKRPPIPKFYISSQKTLKDFIDKAKSLALVNQKQDGEVVWEKFYTAFIFGDTDYEGICDFMLMEGNIDDRLKNKVKSIAISQGMLPYGEVLFYDKINCEMEEGKEPYRFYSSGDFGVGARVSLDEGEDETKLDQWQSIKINGNFLVLLTTEEDLKGRCMLFSAIGCIPTFKGTHIYSADPESFRPIEAYIFPVMQ